MKTETEVTEDKLLLSRKTESRKKYSYTREEILKIKDTCLMFPRPLDLSPFFCRDEPDNLLAKAHAEHQNKAHKQHERNEGRVDKEEPKHRGNPRENWNNTNWGSSPSKFNNKRTEHQKNEEAEFENRKREVENRHIDQIVEENRKEFMIPSRGKPNVKSGVPPPGFHSPGKSLPRTVGKPNRVSEEKETEPKEANSELSPNGEPPTKDPLNQTVEPFTDLQKFKSEGISTNFIDNLFAPGAEFNSFNDSPVDLNLNFSLPHTEFIPGKHDPDVITSNINDNQSKENTSNTMPPALLALFQASKQAETNKKNTSNNLNHRTGQESTDKSITSTQQHSSGVSPFGEENRNTEVSFGEHKSTQEFMLSSEPSEDTDDTDTTEHFEGIPVIENSRGFGRWFGGSNSSSSNTTDMSHGTQPKESETSERAHTILGAKKKPAAATPSKNKGKLSLADMPALPSAVTPLSSFESAAAPNNHNHNHSNNTRAPFADKFHLGNGLFPAFPTTSGNAPSHVASPLSPRPTYPSTMTPGSSTPHSSHPTSATAPSAMLAALSSSTELESTSFITSLLQPTQNLALLGAEQSGLAPASSSSSVVTELNYPPLFSSLLVSSTTTTTATTTGSSPSPAVSTPPSHAVPAGSAAAVKPHSVSHSVTEGGVSHAHSPVVHPHQHTQHQQQLHHPAAAVNHLDPRSTATHPHFAHNAPLPGHPHQQQHLQPHNATLTHQLPQGLAAASIPPLHPPTHPSPSPPMTAGAAYPPPNSPMMPMGFNPYSNHPAALNFPQGYPPAFLPYPPPPMFPMAGTFSHLPPHMMYPPAAAPPLSPLQKLFGSQTAPHAGVMPPSPPVHALSVEDIERMHFQTVQRN